MKRSTLLPSTLPLTLAAALALTSATGHAAEPTPADCLSPNETSRALYGQHKLRAARGELLNCLALAASPTCPADVRTECARRMADVNASMPTVVFEAKDPDGNDLGAVKVTMDGQVLVERLEGMALWIDPGEHTFAFESTGLPIIQKQLLIREGEKERRERITFTPGPVSAPSAEPAMPSNPADGVPAPPAPPPQGRDEASASGADSRGTRRTIGYVVAILGLGAVSLGIYEQTTALGLDADSNAAATSPHSGVRATTHDLYQRAVRAQTYALLSSAIGVAAFGTGLYLVLGSSKAESRAPSARRLRVIPALGFGAGGVLLERNW